MQRTGAECKRSQACTGFHVSSGIQEIKTLCGMRAMRRLLLALLFRRPAVQGQALLLIYICTDKSTRTEQQTY
eukprot:1147379-Pelagomonas_calceolata.AAC.3